MASTVALHAAATVAVAHADAQGDAVGAADLAVVAVERQGLRPPDVLVEHVPGGWDPVEPLSAAPLVGVVDKGQDAECLVDLHPASRA